MHMFCISRLTLNYFGKLLDTLDQDDVPACFKRNSPGK